MVNKVREWIKRESMIIHGDKIVVGVSGGADSVALLLVLLELSKEYDLKLWAVHVNHGIRGEEADGDAGYVKELCEKYNVTCFVYEASVPELSKAWHVSEETAGRKYRYQCFAKVAGETGAAKIATAHHMGDQAETVLFHMIRGTNLSGMTGMKPVTEFEEGDGGLLVIRPLLFCEKTEITDYLNKHGIVWCEDSTNQDNSYARNKIRNLVIPSLEEVNDKAVSHISEFALLMSEYETFIDSLVDEYMKGCVRNGDACEILRTNLRAQNPLLAKAVIYRMITDVAGAKQDITGRHVNSVYELLGVTSGKKVSLPYGIEAVVSYDRLIIRKENAEYYASFFDYTISLDEIRNKPEGIRISLPDKGVLKIEVIKNRDFENVVKNVKNNYTKVFDCDTMKFALHIRNPLQNDYFIIDEEGNRKRASRYFIDNKIPLDDRESQVFAALENEILWHIGGRRGERYKVNESTENILRLSYEGGYDGGPD